MRIVTHINSIGRESTFDAIESNRREIPQPSPIILWINQTPVLTDEFVIKVRPMVDDMVVSSINYCDFSTSLNLLYLDYDLFLFQQDDCRLNSRSIARAVRLFEDNPSLGAVGALTIREGLTEDMVVDNPTCVPDLGILFNRKAIEAVGSLRPSFPSYGLSYTELICRMFNHGWHMVVLRDYADHIGEPHLGSGNLKSPDKIHDESRKVFRAVEAKRFPVGDWWKRNTYI